MNEQLENLSRDIETFKNRNSGTESTASEIKNSLPALSNLEMIKELANLNTDLLKLSSLRNREKKRLKQNEQSFYNLWDNITGPSVCVFKIPEGREREKRREMQRIGKRHSLELPSRQRVNTQALPEQLQCAWYLVTSFMEAWEVDSISSPFHSQGY